MMLATPIRDMMLINLKSIEMELDKYVPRGTRKLPEGIFKKLV